MKRKSSAPTWFLLALLASLSGSSPLPAAKTPESAKENRVPEGISASDWQSIRAAHEAWKHAVEPVKGGWQARNPAQQWTTKFDGRGFEAKPQHAAWTWGLELRSYGAGDQQRAVNGTPEVKTEGHRLAYHWDETVQEWYVNDGRGLEHGFSVQERPPGPSDAPLTFVLATRGPLRAAVTGDARAVDYRDKSGATVLTYSGLRVWDADGRELEARFAPAKDGVTLQVDAKDARYPLLIDPIAQQAYFKASNAQQGDNFGASVAISGDTVVVGAPGEGSSTTGVNTGSNENAPGSGAVYVFARAAGVWAQQAYLKASNTGANDDFGRAVAIAGDTIVVGAPGEDSNAKGVNGSENNDLASNSGAGYIFARNGTNWTQQAYLKAHNAGSDDVFGSSVAVSGATVVVGAPYEEGDQGAVYVFAYEGTKWTQQTYLKASNPDAFDWFGSAVDVSEGTTSNDAIIVGAPGEDGNATGVNGSENNNLAINSGAAYAFTRSGTQWSQLAYLKASNTGANDKFGSSVAISGLRLVIGAPGEDSDAKGVNGSESNNSASGSGAAYVFTRTRVLSGPATGVLQIWSQQAYLKASNTRPDDSFGTAVGIDDTIVVVGAPEEDSSSKGVNGSGINSTAPDSGAVYVFQQNGTTWSQQAYVKASNAGTGDTFGDAVAVSGTIVVAGAPKEDSDSKGVGGSQDNEFAPDSGAVYVFAGPVITSAAAANGQVGTPFSYLTTAAALASVDNFGAIGLPAGLSINATTGVITGTPKVAGKFDVTLLATNGGGTRTAALNLTIAKGAQKLTFKPAAVQKFKKGRKFTLSATATSKLPVSFKSSNTKILSIKGRTATIRAKGKVTVTAVQGGNANYLPAKAVKRTITIK